MTIAAALPTTMLIAHPIANEPGWAMVACPECGVWRRREIIPRTTPVIECHGEPLAVAVGDEPFRPEWLHWFCGRNTLSAAYAFWAANVRR